MAAARGLSRERGQLTEMLQAGLPWLPCYDRRDAIIVRDTLVKMFRIEASVESRHALAISSYVASRLGPSSSPDHPPSGQGPSAWLAAYGIDAGGIVTPRHVRAAERGGSVKWAAPPPKPAPSSDAVDESAAIRDEELVNTCPIWALKAYDWRHQLGASCVLHMPFGTLHVPPPKRLRWLLWPVEPVPQPPDSIKVGVTHLMLWSWVGVQCLSLIHI